MIKVELKGPENTLRVRQVKVLGWKEGESIKILGQISASMAQQKNCEAETLRVFRLITSQVRVTASSTRDHLTNIWRLSAALRFTLLCSFRSLESSFVETQSRRQSRRRKTSFQHPRERTRSGPDSLPVLLNQNVDFPLA